MTLSQAPHRRGGGLSVRSTNGLDVAWARSFYQADTAFSGRLDPAVGKQQTLKSTAPFSVRQVGGLSEQPLGCGGCLVELWWSLRAPPTAQ